MPYKIHPTAGHCVTDDGERWMAVTGGLVRMLLLRHRCIVYFLSCCARLICRCRLPAVCEKKDIKLSTKIIRTLMEYIPAETCTCDGKLYGKRNPSDPITMEMKIEETRWRRDSVAEWDYLRKNAIIWIYNTDRRERAQVIDIEPEPGTKEAKFKSLTCNTSIDITLKSQLMCCIVCGRLVQKIN